MYRKILKIGAILTALAIITVGTVTITAVDIERADSSYNKVHYWTLEMERQAELKTLHESSLIKGIISGLASTWVASIIIPMIANNTGVLATNPDLNTQEQSIAESWTTFIMVGFTVGLITTFLT